MGCPCEKVSSTDLEYIYSHTDLFPDINPVLGIKLKFHKIIIAYFGVDVVLPKYYDFFSDFIIRK